MPRSKHKNGKLIRELNSKIKRSKKTRASKLKLRNKCGGASGRSPTRPARAASYLSAVNNSTRSHNRSSRSRSASNNSKKKKKIQKD